MPRQKRDKLMADSNKRESKQQRKNTQPPDKPEIRLSVPWNDQLQCFTPFPERQNDTDIQMAFIQERTRLHELYIREESRNKRLTLIIAVILFLIGCSAILFAPSGREVAFNWIGAAMLVVAAGSAGYKRVWGKSKPFEVGADQDRGKH
jgi:hypothetical protein